MSNFLVAKSDLHEATGPARQIDQQTFSRFRPRIGRFSRDLLGAMI